MKILLQIRGKLKNITRQETAANPAQEKGMAYSTEIDICILPVRGTTRLEFGKRGEWLLGQSLERFGISLPLIGTRRWRVQSSKCVKCFKGTISAWSKDVW